MQSELRIEEIKIPDGVLLRFKGSIDASNTGSIKGFFEKNLKSGIIIADLNQVDFIDSSGLGLFVSYAKEHYHRGFIRLCNVNPFISRTIAISRLERILSIFSSVEEARQKTRPKRIVVIEKENETRVIIQAILEEFGYNVLSLSDVNDLVRLANAKPDLMILSYVNMAAVRNYLKIYGEVPVLNLISSDDENKTVYANRIIKPFEPYDLLGKVRILLEDKSGSGISIIGLISDDKVVDEIDYILKTHGYNFLNCKTYHIFAREALKGNWHSIIVGDDPIGVSSLEVLLDRMHTELFKGMHLPIIAVGSSKTAEDVKRLLIKGADDIVSLPLFPEVLIGKLAKLLRL